jgi:hypothetical protein
VNHLIRLIGADAVQFWCGRYQKTPSGRYPGPPDTGVLGKHQLEAWLRGGRRVCLQCVKVFREGKK